MCTKLKSPCSVWDGDEEDNLNIRIAMARRNERIINEGRVRELALDGGVQRKNRVKRAGRPFQLLCKRMQGMLHYALLRMRVGVPSPNTSPQSAVVPAVDCRSCRPCAEGGHNHSSRNGAFCAPISSWPAHHRLLHRCIRITGKGSEVSTQYLPSGAVERWPDAAPC